MPASEPKRAHGPKVGAHVNGWPVRLIIAAVLGVLAMQSVPAAAQSAGACPPLSTPEPGTSGADAGGDVTATTSGMANLRAAPDARAEVVGREDAGTVFAVVGRDARARWVYVLAPPPLATPGGLPDAPDRGASEGWLAVLALCEARDWAAVLDVYPPAGEHTPDPGPAGLAYAAAYGRVNVRAAPDVNAPVVEQLDAGERVVLIARSSPGNDWLLALLDAAPAETPAAGRVGQGWIAYFTVTVEGDLNALPVLVPNAADDGLIAPAAVVRTAFNARLRAEPQAEAEVLAVVAFGEAVLPIGRTADGAWLLVRYGDISAWGAAELFDMAAPAAEALPVLAAPAAAPGDAPVPTATPAGAG